MNDETTLLPCPFCGCEADMKHVTQLWEPRNSYWAQCGNCRMSGKHYETEAEAIAAWNTRAEMDYEDALILLDELGVSERTCRNTQSDFDFMCSECGKCVDNGRAIGINYCPNCGARVVE